MAGRREREPEPERGGARRRDLSRVSSSQKVNTGVQQMSELPSKGPWLNSHNVKGKDKGDDGAIRHQDQAGPGAGLVRHQLHYIVRHCCAFVAFATSVSVMTTKSVWLGPRRIIQSNETGLLSLLATAERIASCASYPLYGLRCDKGGKGRVSV